MCVHVGGGGGDEGYVVGHGVLCCGGWMVMVLVVCGYGVQWMVEW